MDRREALRRMDGFVDQHADVLGGVSKALSRREVTRAVRSLDQLEEDQQDALALGKRQSAEKQTLREDIRAHMRTISILARGHLSDSPHLPTLAPPRYQSDAELIAAAIEMSEATAHHLRDFTRLRLPAQFIRELRPIAVELAKIVEARSASRMRVSSATYVIRETLRSVVADVKVLDALTRPRLDAQLLSVWDAVRRVSAPWSMASEAQPYAEEAA